MIEEKAGRVIGGTSSINAMIYNRGNPLDYEGWAATGLKDWDYAHVLPYFRKLESFVDGPDEWRGGDGPVHVTSESSTDGATEKKASADPSDTEDEARRRRRLPIAG